MCLRLSHVVLPGKRNFVFRGNSCARFVESLLSRSFKSARGCLSRLSQVQYFNGTCYRVYHAFALYKLLGCNTQRVMVSTKTLPIARGYGFLLRFSSAPVTGNGSAVFGWICTYSIWQTSPSPPMPSALDIALEPPCPLEFFESTD